MPPANVVVAPVVVTGLVGVIGVRLKRAMPGLLGSEFRADGKLLGSREYLSQELQGVLGRWTTVP